MMQQYRVEFDNGDAGEYSCEVGKHPKFTVGATAQYDMVDNGRGGKKVQAISGGFGGGGPRPDNSPEIMAQCAFKGAIELIVAGKVELKDLAVTVGRCAEIMQEATKTLKGKQ
jgi:hypothetical protein